MSAKGPLIFGIQSVWCNKVNDFIVKLPDGTFQGFNKRYDRNKLVMTLDEYMLPPPPRVDNSWNTQDWIKVYSQLKMRRFELRDKLSNNSISFVREELNELNELIRKLEFMFREEPSQKSGNGTSVVPAGTVYA